MVGSNNQPIGTRGRPVHRTRATAAGSGQSQMIARLKTKSNSDKLSSSRSESMKRKTTVQSRDSSTTPVLSKRKRTTLSTEQSSPQTTHRERPAHGRASVVSIRGKATGKPLTSLTRTHKKAAHAIRGKVWRKLHQTLRKRSAAQSSDALSNEMRRLETTSGFWSSRASQRTNSPGSQTASATTVSTTLTTDTSTRGKQPAATKGSELKTKTESSGEKSTHKRTGPLPELRRLQTTSGFSFPGAAALVSRATTKTSRDESPGSSSSLDRASGNSGKSTDNKSGALPAPKTVRDDSPASSSSLDRAPGPQENRGRGRPPKPKTPREDSPASVSSLDRSTGPQENRGRGRPPKPKTPREDSPASVSSLDRSTGPQENRGRGRPPKPKTPREDSPASVSSLDRSTGPQENRGRGRPPKPKTPREDSPASVSSLDRSTGPRENRGRGRPPKLKTPREDSPEFVSSLDRTSGPQENRGRGRPPKPKTPRDDSPASVSSLDRITGSRSRSAGQKSAQRVSATTSRDSSPASNSSSLERVSRSQIKSAEQKSVRQLGSKTREGSSASRSSLERSSGSGIKSGGQKNSQRLRSKTHKDGSPVSNSPHDRNSTSRAKLSVQESSNVKDDEGKNTSPAPGNISLGELRRLITTQGFWSPSFGEPGIRSSRDLSPASTLTAEKAGRSRSSTQDYKDQTNVKELADGPASVTPGQSGVGKSGAHSGKASSSKKQDSVAKSSSDNRKPDKEPLSTPGMHTADAARRSRRKPEQDSVLSDGSKLVKDELPELERLKRRLSNSLSLVSKKGGGQEDHGEAGTLQSPERMQVETKSEGSSRRGSAEIFISDLLGSSELKRLDTTPGFWAPTPDIGFVLSRSSARRSKEGHVSRSPTSKILPPSPTRKQESSLLQHRKKKLQSLKAARQKNQAKRGKIPVSPVSRERQKRSVAPVDSDEADTSEDGRKKRKKFYTMTRKRKGLKGVSPSMMKYLREATRLHPNSRKVNQLVSDIYQKVNNKSNFIRLLNMPGLSEAQGKEQQTTAQADHKVKTEPLPTSSRAGRAAKLGESKVLRTRTSVKQEVAPQEDKELSTTGTVAVKERQTRQSQTQRSEAVSGKKFALHNNNNNNVEVKKTPISTTELSHGKSSAQRQEEDMIVAEDAKGQLDEAQATLSTSTAPTDTEEVEEKVIPDESARGEVCLPSEAVDADGVVDDAIKSDPAISSSNSGVPESTSLVTDESTSQVTDRSDVVGEKSQSISTSSGQRISTLALPKSLSVLKSGVGKEVQKTNVEQQTDNSTDVSAPSGDAGVIRSEDEVKENHMTLVTGTTSRDVSTDSCNAPEGSRASVPQGVTEEEGVCISEANQSGVSDLEVPPVETVQLNTQTRRQDISVGKSNLATDEMDGGEASDPTNVTATDEDRVSEIIEQETGDCKDNGAVAACSSVSVSGQDVDGGVEEISGRQPDVDGAENSVAVRQDVKGGVAELGSSEMADTDVGSEETTHVPHTASVVAEKSVGGGRFVRKGRKIIFTRKEPSVNVVDQSGTGVGESGEGAGRGRAGTPSKRFPPRSAAWLKSPLHRVRKQARRAWHRGVVRTDAGIHKSQTDEQIVAQVSEQPEVVTNEQANSVQVTSDLSVVTDVQGVDKPETVIEADIGVSEGPDKRVEGAKICAENESQSVTSGEASVSENSTGLLEDSGAEKTTVSPLAAEGGHSEDDKVTKLPEEAKEASAEVFPEPPTLVPVDNLNNLEAPQLTPEGQKEETSNSLQLPQTDEVNGCGPVTSSGQQGETPNSDYLKKQAKKKKTLAMLKRLHTDANLANAVMDKDTLQTRAKRGVLPVQSSGEGHKKRLKQDGTFKDVSSKLKGRRPGPGRPLRINIPSEGEGVKRGRGRPRKYSGGPLPQLTPTDTVRAENMCPVYTTPPILSPQVITVPGGGKAESQFSNWSQEKQEFEAVPEGVDEDYHLYLSGVSDEDSSASPMKGPAVSPIKLPIDVKIAPPQLLGEESKSDGSKMEKAGSLKLVAGPASLPSEANLKKVARRKMKGKRGRPPGMPMSVEYAFKRPRTARKSITVAKESYAVVAPAHSPSVSGRKFEFRKKSTRSPIEMLEMKRKQEEAMYDQEEERRLARLQLLRQKRNARLTYDEDPSFEEEEEVEDNLQPCAVVLSDFVKKLQLDAYDTHGDNMAHMYGIGSPDSPERDEDNDEDWCADLEDVEDEDEEEWRAKGMRESRPYIPRLKIKRVLKKGKAAQVKKSASTDGPESRHEPIKLIIKTETVATAESSGQQSKAVVTSASPQQFDLNKVERTGFEGSFLQFLKGQQGESLGSIKPTGGKKYWHKVQQPTTTKESPEISPPHSVPSTAAATTTTTTTQSQPIPSVSTLPPSSDTSKQLTSYSSPKKNVPALPDSHKTAAVSAAVDDDEEDILILDLEDNSSPDVSGGQAGPDSEAALTPNEEASKAGTWTAGSENSGAVPNTRDKEGTQPGVEHVASEESERSLDKVSQKVDDMACQTGPVRKALSNDEMNLMQLSYAEEEKTEAVSAAPAVLSVTHTVTTATIPVTPAVVSTPPVITTIATPAESVTATTSVMSAAVTPVVLPALPVTAASTLDVMPAAPATSDKAALTPVIPAASAPTLAATSGASTPSVSTLDTSSSHSTVSVTAASHSDTSATTTSVSVPVTSVTQVTTATIASAVAVTSVTVATPSVTLIAATCATTPAAPSVSVSVASTCVASAAAPTGASTVQHESHSNSDAAVIDNSNRTESSEQPEDTEESPVRVTETLNSQVPLGQDSGKNVSQKVVGTDAMAENVSQKVVGTDVMASQKEDSAASAQKEMSPAQLSVEEKNMSQSEKTSLKSSDTQQQLEGIDEAQVNQPDSVSIDRGTAQVLDKSTIDTLTKTTSVPGESCSPGVESQSPAVKRGGETNRSPKSNIALTKTGDEWKLKHVLHTDKQPSGRYTCKRCNFSAVTVLTIESHIYSHIPGVQFRCAYCESEFSSMAATATHLKNTHAIKEAKFHISRYIEEKNFYDREEGSPAQTSVPQVSVSPTVEGQSPPVYISVVVSGSVGRGGRAVSSRRFVCTHCGFSTNVRDDAEHHVSDLHSSQSLYACVLCDENVFYSEPEIKQHSASVHPTRVRPYRRLPDFYDAERLHMKQEAANVEDSPENILGRVSSMLQREEADLDSSAVDHRQKAKDYLYLQEGWKEKRSAEADSTTAGDYTEETVAEEDGASADVVMDTDEPTGSAGEVTEGDNEATSGDAASDKDLTDQGETQEEPDVSKPGSKDSSISESISSTASTQQQGEEQAPSGDSAAPEKPVTPSVSSLSDKEQSSEGTSRKEQTSSSQGDKNVAPAMALDSSLSSPQTKETEVRLPESWPPVSGPQTSTTGPATDAAPQAEESIAPGADQQDGDSGLKIVEVVSLSGQQDSPFSCEESPASQSPVKTASSGHADNEQVAGNETSKTGLPETSKPTSIAKDSAPLADIGPSGDSSRPRQQISTPITASSLSSASASSSSQSASSTPATTSSTATSSSPGSQSSSSGGRLPLSYKCGACKVHTPYLLMMVKHLKAKHPHIDCFACPYCKHTLCFSSQKQLRGHVKQNHPDKLSRNEISLSDEAKKLVEAMVLPSSPECVRVGNRLVLEEDIHTCTYCHLKMTSLASVYEHLNDLHSDLFEFVCPVCQSFKHKVLAEIANHCTSVHQATLDTDKVHVSVPKNLFSVLTCISKNGKYIEKSLDAPQEASSNSSTPASSSVEESSSSSSRSEESAKRPHKATTEQTQGPVATRAPQMPETRPAPVVKSNTRIAPAPAISTRTVTTPVALAPLMSPAPLIAIPLTQMVTSVPSRPLVAFSSALFDTSSMPGPPQVALTSPTPPIGLVHSAGAPAAASFLSPRQLLASSITKPQTLRPAPPLQHKPQAGHTHGAGGSKNLPVLNVPTIRPRQSPTTSTPSPSPRSSSNNKNSNQPINLSSPPASSPSLASTASFLHPASVNSVADNLPDTEPNPDAFKIFNLRPSAPPAPIAPPPPPAAPSPSGPGLYPAVSVSLTPTVFPPVSGSSLPGGFIPGHMAGFPPGMVIPQALLPQAFSFHQAQAQARATQSPSGTLASASSKPRQSPASHRHKAPSPAASTATPHSLNSRAATTAMLLKQQQQELYQLKQQQLSRQALELQRQRMMSSSKHKAQSSPMLHPAFPRPQLLTHPALGISFPPGPSASTSSPTASHSPHLASPESHSATSSPLGGTPSHAGVRPTKGIHKRSTSMYQCPYCPVPVSMKAIEVPSHIQQQHPGQPVLFKKIV